MRRLAFFGLVLCLGLIQGCSHTKEDISGIALLPRVKTLLDEFPAGSIDSVKKADEVRDAVDYENKMLDFLYGLKMDGCTKKFLVNDCYEETKLHFRAYRAALKPLSIEADRFKRTEKVRLRDEALVDAGQAELAREPEREESRRKYAEKQARYIQDRAAAEADAKSAGRQASRKKYEEKQERYLDMKVPDEASPPELRDGAYTAGTPSRLKDPDTVLTPEERARNIREHEAKKQDSLKKQESVERRMAETQVKREKRAEKENQEVTRKQKVAKD